MKEDFRRRVGFNEGDVTDVMVNGRWLMRGRQLVTLDEERILYEADQRAQAMVQRGMSQVREYKG